jgi:hypothetical protein
MDIQRNVSRDNPESSPDSPVIKPHSRFRCNVWSLLIATMVIVVLLATLLPLFWRLRRWEHQKQCKDNLKQIALALFNYRDVHKAFPWPCVYSDKGTPMHSWRVAIAPYVVQNAFYDSYDFRQAWNGPSNVRLSDDIPEVPQPARGQAQVGTDERKYGGVVFDAAYFGYRCPSAPPSQGRMCTNYVLLIDDRPGKPNGPPHLPGSVPLSPSSGAAVIIIEIADSDIYWMEPRDVLLSGLSMKINDRSQRCLSSYHGGACVLYADRTVEILDDATTEERVRELLTQ